MKLEINNLSKSFDQQVVLKDINLTLEKGKIYALLGRNGAGKTTFFNCISQEIPYDQGTVCFEDGSPLTQQDVGFVYTNPMLPEFLTGLEFLTFFIDIHKDQGFKREDVHSYFDTIQFNQDDRYKLIKDYSHGMRNKLQMLCIMMLKPKVLFLDEPLTSFDVVASIEMKRQLVAFKEDCIMVLSTHMMQIAEDICDEVIILHHGEASILDFGRLHDPSFEEDIIHILSDNHQS
ncbi:ABC transporter ATP-binding protein [Erysipelothrix piscisicarius]|uniref:ABC transporter ATP-binding protein n=1 Tax=Erysipelothrix piscisicarius TaxID=2485784 RepID=A0A3S8RME3_9FIRM|nr:ABC transporter ATP-binding protein [Erysipelothrix piscisicarius]AZK44121.1 ABC transporter ATP-binding protein [Erysipelothrix piscisicarius]